MSGFVESSSELSRRLDNSNWSELSRRLDAATNFVYVFMNAIGYYNYILYRIDALEHLHNSNSSCQQPLYDLQPLLVFHHSILPEYCTCVKLESNFYFMSINMYAPSFGIKDDDAQRRDKRRDVFMIRESDLKDLQPSELNTDVEKYLIKCAPMNEFKDHPTVFVAQNKLYVLSTHRQFEVYSPKLNSWRVLPPQPESHWGMVDCFVVVGETVYFQFDGFPILSFHLKEEKWGIMPLIPPKLSKFEFRFPRPLVPTLDMGFSFLYEEDDDIDNNVRHLTIYATPLPGNTNFISQDFMLPSIPFDCDFSHALNSSRCPDVPNKSNGTFSDYIFGLDGGKLLCLISWGMGNAISSHLQKDVNAFCYPDTYATLTFFKVAPSRAPECNVNNASVNYANKKRDRTRYVSRTSFKSKLRRCSEAKRQHSKGHAPNVDYENEKADDGKYVDKRYFKAKLLHSAQFIIKTNNLNTAGSIVACLSEGL